MPRQPQCLGSLEGGARIKEQPMTQPDAAAAERWNKGYDWNESPQAASDSGELADFAARLLDETPVTPAILLRLGFREFDSGFRNEKVLQRDCILIRFVACEGPLCWKCCSRW